MDSGHVASQRLQQDVYIKDPAQIYLESTDTGNWILVTLKVVLELIIIMPILDFSIVMEISLLIRQTKMV